jgi:hypothetical protein
MSTQIRGNKVENKLMSLTHLKAKNIYKNLALHPLVFELMFLQDFHQNGVHNLSKFSPIDGQLSFFPFPTNFISISKKKFGS